MGDSSNEGQAVLADAQFGMVQIMRPVAGFETTYEGRSAAEPIYLFPEGQHIDPIAAAGVAGYDPVLARGLKTPFGARIAIWLPNLFFTSDVERGYELILIWRLRNVSDFANGRIPYHFPRAQGAINTTAPAGSQARVPIPAAYNTITYIQTEPLTQRGRAINNIHSEDLEFSTDTVLGPLLADGVTRQPVQQGILDPAVVTDADRPGFIVHEVQALGDEVVMALRRNVTGAANWAFATTDLRFSQFLGSGTGLQLPSVGAYALMGTAP